MYSKESLSKDSEFHLEAKIGFPSAYSIITGTIIGSGIFVSPVGVLSWVDGSIGISLIVWLVCGALSALAALCYCELGTCIRESGADFAYNRVAYGPSLAFLYAWTTVLVIRSSVAAASTITFGTYLMKPFFPDCESPEIAIKFVGLCMALLTCYINSVSVKRAAQVQVAFTVAKLFALTVIIVAGLWNLIKRNPVAISNFSNAFEPKELSVTQISLALYQGLFSYNGWGNLNYLTEEVRAPHKNLPRAIVASLITVTIFYFLVNIAYLSVLTPEEMMSSKAVAVTFGQKVLGPAAWVMSISVCLSTMGSVHGGYITGARVSFVAARRGQMPDILSMISVRYLTPLPAISLAALLIVCLVIPGNFDSLLNAFAFTNWLFYGLGATAVLVLRKKRPDLPRPYRVPTVIPIIVIIMSAYLVVAPFLNSPDIMYIYVILFMLSGFLFYYPFVLKKWKVPGLYHITTFLQKILNVAPTDWDE